MEFDITLVFKSLYGALAANEGNRITQELMEGIIAKAAQPWNEHVKQVETEKQNGNTSDTD